LSNAAPAAVLSHTHQTSTDSEWDAEVRRPLARRRTSAPAKASPRDARVKRERGWKPHEQWAALIAESAALGEKLLEWPARTEQLEIVVMSRGTFTADRNALGVEAAHFPKVDTECGRWKDELISAQGNTRA
jgi:hypothetical protein